LCCLKPSSKNGETLMFLVSSRFLQRILVQTLMRWMLQYRVNKCVFNSLRKLSSDVNLKFICPALFPACIGIVDGDLDDCSPLLYL